MNKEKTIERIKWIGLRIADSNNLETFQYYSNELTLAVKMLDDMRMENV